MYRLQAYCTGLGWVNTRLESGSYPAMKTLQSEFMRNDAAWMRGNRETRILLPNGSTNQHMHFDPDE